MIGIVLVWSRLSLERLVSILIGTSVEFLEFTPPPIDFNPPLLSEISNYSYSEMRQVRAPQAKMLAKFVIF